MNFYSLEKMGLDKAARLHKEAAVATVVRAGGTPTVSQLAAGALRRLAERLDHGQASLGRSPVEVTQPTVVLARRAA